MCQVCANQGNITKEVKVEVISRKGSVTSFSRYIRSLYMYLTQTCTVIHVGTCTLSLIIMEQDSVKVRGHNKLLPLPERVVSLSLFLFIPLFFCKLDPFLKVSQYFCQDFLCLDCVPACQVKQLYIYSAVIIFLVISGCSLHLCGSSSNGFGHDSSDADFCCIVNNFRQV